MENQKSPEPVKAIMSVSVHDAKDLLHSGYRYLDVRMFQDFNKGHVESAFNVPYYASVMPEGKVKNPQFLEQVSVLFSKDDHILVGFENVKNVTGGYLAWMDNKSTA
ncbi:Thiosulfate sulfurtransferase 18 [Acorus gramineus]|uniref:Thiosulfate sulfurtransferase 18 n=1 Tax=Acorus gramineus TaxID=55184 RepID=A0AAV9B8P3_ACOGR|nr:Thiosulfate sulfurtransferase 18 [Acorus gramineus]